MLDELFTQTLHRHLDSIYAKPWLVGFSGGLDSTVLLFLLHRFAQAHPDLQLNISCVHVNHGLSDHAFDWQNHCQNICEKLGIPLVSKTLGLESVNRSNLEQRAREARYKAIADECLEDTVLFLGHHLDDQAETLLFRLARGAGPKGLAAMAELSNTSFGTKFRPLLEISKGELEKFALENQLNWIEDESNQQNQFDRNFIRNQLMPLASERWPRFAKNLARSALLCAEQQQLLDDQSQEYLASMCVDNTLNISMLRTFSPAWQNQILRMWLMQFGLPMPSVVQLTELKEQMLYAKGDRVPTINIDGQCISRFQEKLYLYKPSVENKYKKIQWDVASVDILELNAQLLKLEKCKEHEPGFCLQQTPITISFGEFSRRFKPANSDKSKPLNQWFKHWKIPPWERQSVPIFAFGDQLVQVGNKVSNEKAADSAASRYKISF